MKTDEIRILIEAFYNGETNAAEEQILLDYFNSDTIAAELLEEKDLFLSLYTADEINVPDNLESKLNNLIDELAEKEEATPRKNKKYLLTWAASVAASIAILLSAGIYFNKGHQRIMKPVADTHKTNNLSEAEMQTLKEAEEALILLSTKFNQGIDQLEVVSSNLDKTNELLNKALKKRKK